MPGTDRPKSLAQIEPKYPVRREANFNQKLNGYDVNNMKSDFTEEEKEALRNSLYDLSESIWKCVGKV